MGTDTSAESGVFEGFSGQSDGDIATVFDPFGTEGSTALAGNGLADLASVFGDGSSAHASYHSQKLEKLRRSVRGCRPLR